MKSIRTKLSTYAIALLIACGLASPSMAGSGDFAGISGALWASAGGAEISGTHEAGRNVTGTETHNNKQDIMTHQANILQGMFQILLLKIHHMLPAHIHQIQNVYYVLYTLIFY